MSHSARRELTLEGEDRVAKIIEVARDAKAQGMVQFDVRGKSVLTDYVLICEGRSQAHCRGVCERVREGLKEFGIRPDGLEGEREGNWVLMDYGDVLLHIFHPEIRSYYQLEKLHESCPMTTWEDEE